MNFDKETDRGNLPIKFPCDTLMTFAGSEYATCQWVGASRIKIYPSSDITLPVPNRGSPIIVKTGILRAKCTPGTSDAACASWSTLAMTNATIAKPDNPILPVINLNGAESIGSCDNFAIELTGSM